MRSEEIYDLSTKLYYTTAMLANVPIHGHPGVCVPVSTDGTWDREAAYLDGAIHQLTDVLKFVKMVNHDSQRNDYGITPEQYHAGLDKLWKALRITGVCDKDVFTLVAERIEELELIRSGGPLPRLN